MSLYCIKIKTDLDAIKGMMNDGIDRLTEKLGGGN